MLRRDFLKLLGIGIGAAAAEQVIPFNRVWSFPAKIVPAGMVELPPGMTLRYVRAWDAASARYLCRLDVLLGFANLPKGIEALKYENKTGQPKYIPTPFADPAAIRVLNNYERSPQWEQYGVLWRALGTAARGARALAELQSFDSLQRRPHVAP